MNRPKAVIYTRVSTDKQAEEGTGLEVQETACLRKAKEIGAEVVDIVTDEGVSGAFYLSRPGIQRALKMIEEGKANVLVTMKLDRSGRDADVLGLIRKRIINAGGKLVFADGMNFENNASGNLMFRVNAGFAEYEKEVIRERTMSGRRRRAEEGQQPSRAVSPFGYHVVNKRDVDRGLYAEAILGKYVMIASEAAIVRQLYLRCVNGDSLRELAKWMNEQAIPTQQGGLMWHRTTLRRLLLNPVYIGAPLFGKNRFRSDESRVTRGLKPIFSQPAPEEERVHLMCEPIIDDATWHACQMRLQENKARLSGARKNKTLLSGLIRCPQCRTTMTSQLKDSHRYYHCKHKSPSRSERLQHCQSAAHRVDHACGLICLNLRWLAHRPERISDALHTHDQQEQAARRQREGGDDAERLRRDLADLGKQETATAKAQVDALMKGRSTDVYDGILSEIDTKRKALLKHLSVVEARERIMPSADHVTTAAKVAEVLHRFDAVLEAPEEEVSTVEKNGLLSTFIEAIWPTDDGYDIDLKLPEGTTVHRITIRSHS